MSEWIRHRGSKSMPKRLEGKYYEAMRRDGTVAAFVNSWLHYGRDSDVLKYRITGDIEQPDHSKGFPVGTTAKDIGAKIGDQFVMISKDHHSVDAGEILSLLRDDGTTQPFFNDSNGELRCSSWHRLAPAPQKTAIELQAKEVGIPEPVQLVDDSQADADGWIEWKGGDCPVPKGTLVDVRYRKGHEEIGIPALEFSSGFNRMSAIDWTDNDAAADITAYRLHQPQEWPEDRMDIVGQNGNDGLHYDDTHLGIKRPDGDGWVKYNAGDVVDLDGVVSIGWVNAQGTAHTARAPRELEWGDGDDRQIAWYRLNYGAEQLTLRDIAPALAEIGATIKLEDAKPNKYQRTIKGVTVDVYDVLAAFGVTCQARGHAIKKLLMAGQHGHKDEAQDLREAVQAIERSIELVEQKQ